MNDNKKMSWKDVSIKKYLQIQEIVNDESLSEEDKSILIANTIYGNYIDNGYIMTQFIENYIVQQANEIESSQI